MALRSALKFVSSARHDVVLRRRLEALGPDVSLAAIAEIGREAGFDFSPADLQEAFARNWAIRAIAYGERFEFDATTLAPGGECSTE